MPLQRPLLTDFTNGEISSKFAGRFDLELYNKGCQTLINWVPFAQGGVRTRPGMQYLGTTRSGAAARLIPFVVSEDNPFVVELTATRLRIWKSGVLVGAPTDLLTSYAAGELFQIQYVKVRNELYLVHTAHPIAVLTWHGTTTFTLRNLEIHFGEGVTAWAAATAYGVDDIVSNGTPMKLYRCLTAGTSGTAASGGPTAEDDDITDGTAHWYWEATKPFSQTGDYPAAIAHFQGRMYYAGGTNHPQTVFASEPFWYGDFNYFSMITYTTTQIKAASTWVNALVPETEDITYTRTVYGEGASFFFEIASDEDDDVYWLLGADALIIGTCSAEWVAPANISALNITVRKRSAFGSAFIQATTFQDAPVFLQGTRSRAALREYAYLAESSELQSPDLTFGADQMLNAGLTQIAIAKMPQPTLFAVTDGELAACLFHKAYGVLAWYHIETNGTIESVCVVPGTTDDDVYVSVLRENGRVVERFGQLWGTTEQQLDSWVNIASIAGATQTGLERFNGKTVTIVNRTDVTVHTAVVTAGSLTYPTGCGVGDLVVIGLAYTCTGQTMRLNTSIETGTGQGSLKRMTAVIARLLESNPFKVGYAQTVNLETARRPDGAAWTVAYTGVVGAYTGDVHIPFAGDWDRDAWVWFIQDAPQRTTILTLIPEVAT